MPESVGHHDLRAATAGNALIGSKENGRPADRPTHGDEKRRGGEGTDRPTDGRAGEYKRASKPADGMPQIANHLLPASGG